MKHVAAKNRRLPLVIVNHMYNDYLGGRASLTRTGASGTTDMPIPANVRMYDIAGAAHINEREQNKACREGHSQLDWSPALRAQLVALDEWVQGKAAPPPSQLLVLEPRTNDPDVLQAPCLSCLSHSLGPKTRWRWQSFGRHSLAQYGGADREPWLHECPADGACLPTGRHVSTLRPNCHGPKNLK